MQINSSYGLSPLNNQNQSTNQKEINSTNEFVSESDRRKKILDEKYSKIHEQNMRYENPNHHIRDKYRDIYSPLFRSDLTKMEREAALTMEMSWLRNGKGGSKCTRVVFSYYEK